MGEEREREGDIIVHPCFAMCFKCDTDTKTDISSSMVGWPNRKHMPLHMKLYTECLSMFMPVIYLVRLHDLGVLQEQPSHTK